MIRKTPRKTGYILIASSVVVLWVLILAYALYARAAQLMTLESEGALPAAVLQDSEFSAAGFAWTQNQSGTVRVPCTRGIPQPPAIQAHSAVVLDAASGALLFEKNPDQSIPPASLTKLVSMYVVMQAVEDGTIDVSDTLIPPQQAWASSMPHGSSLMFLGKNQRVSVEELLQGLAVVSGNDAAVALAIYTAGSVSAFVKQMNAVVRELGLQHTHFEDPNGLSEYNRTTARDFARFSAVYIRKYPEHLKRFHSLRYFSYPKPHNMLTPQAEFRQPATNTLLGKLDGCDGLKTGFIYESGFNIALTAQRNGSRFIVVILGGGGKTMEEGKHIREENGKVLMEWAFKHFSTCYVHNFPLHLPVIPVVGAKDPAARTAMRPCIGMLHGTNGAFTVPISKSSSVGDYKAGGTVEVRVRCPYTLEAPVKAGQKIGTVQFFTNRQADEYVLAEFPLVSYKTIEKGSTLRLKYDSLALRLYRNLLKK